MEKTTPKFPRATASLRAGGRFSLDDILPTMTRLGLSRIPLVEAAPRAMYGERWAEFPADGKYPEEAKGWDARSKIPHPPQWDFAVFREGLLELCAINPELRFWGGIDENAANWPKWARSRF